MAKYYFLVPSLPPLFLFEKPDITFAQLMASLRINLTKRDLEQVKILLRLIDLHNIRALFLEEKIDPRGNLNEKELDEALLIKNILPPYVFDFLDQFEKISDRIRHFSGLLALYFEQEIPKAKGFLKKYLLFERNARLVLLALRAKQLKRDIVQELQFFDFSDPLVAHILAQKDAESYEPLEEFKELKELFLSCRKDPWLENKLFAEYRFKKIEEMSLQNFFSIDQVLAYVAQFLIVEYLLELDVERGKLILDTFKVG